VKRALTLWVYEGHETKVPIFFEVLAPFQRALGDALEDGIDRGVFTPQAMVGVEEVTYHRKMRAIRMICVSQASVTPIKNLVSALRIEGKRYRAWAEGEEPEIFSMVAFLSPWQRTRLERIGSVLEYYNPGIPLEGCEFKAVWEQSSSRKVDIKAAEPFYKFVRDHNWRLKYTQGYADCFVGVHGETAVRQEHAQVSPGYLSYIS
jgi:hypothetical protein